MDLVQVFEETLSIAERGCYVLTIDGESIGVRLKSGCRDVLAGESLPRDLYDNRWFMKWCASQETKKPCVFEVTNEDSLSCAARLIELSRLRENECEYEKPPLVLNFANPVVPGGGVRKGARAQEEDLCRRSTLYLSLTSDDARGYYEKNRTYDDYLYSDDLLISPCVEVFRDGNNQLLPQPFTVAVLTVAAPIARYADKDTDFGSIFKRRATKMLASARDLGYSRLVLGAWGCGAFGNDARVVSQAFFEAFQEFEAAHGCEPGGAFSHVCFAVLSRSGYYNLVAFKDAFDRYYALYGEGASSDFFRERQHRREFVSRVSSFEQGKSCSRGAAPVYGRGILNVEKRRPGHVGGRYELHARIARGACSELLSAYDRVFEREVMVRRIGIPEFPLGESTLQGIVQRIKHRANAGIPPHILPELLCVSREDDSVYVVMEPVEGTTLKEITQSSGAQEPRTILSWTWELCVLLDGLHGLNPPWVHGDVSPDNIVLTSGGHVRLLEGQCMHECGSGSELDQVALGSIGYIAPETYEMRAKPDVRSDIYSIGATMQYLLLGKNPERGSGFESLNDEHSRIDGDLAYIIEKCMKHDPNDRYQSCGELSEDLSRCLRGESLVSRKRGLFGRKKRKKTSDSAPVVASGEKASI